MPMACRTQSRSIGSDALAPADLRLGLSFESTHCERHRLVAAVPGDMLVDGAEHRSAPRPVRLEPSASRQAPMRYPEHPDAALMLDELEDDAFVIDALSQHTQSGAPAGSRFTTERSRGGRSVNTSWRKRISTSRMPSGLRTRCRFKRGE